MGIKAYLSRLLRSAVICLPPQKVFGQGGEARSSPPRDPLSLLRVRIVLRVGQVREGLPQWHVVGIDAIAELVVRRMVEVGRENRTPREGPKLDVDHVVDRPAPVREARVIPVQNSQPARIV